MPSEHEHLIVTRALEVKRKAEALAPSPAADGVKAEIAALIVALADCGYTFPRESA